MKLKDINLQYEKQELNAAVEEYKQQSIFSFFVKHSYRDIGRKKFHFCLSFCSVFVVVFSALIINTMIEKGPIIFLKLAEADMGQYDGVIYPAKGVYDNDGDIETFQNTDGKFINYTRV